MAPSRVAPVSGMPDLAPDGAPGDAELRTLAVARPALAWRPGTDISRARNAHATNRREELADALRGDYDFLEVDVRVGPDGRAILQHELGDPVDLDLHGFLAIAGPSGRGLKFDVKEREALPLVLDAARRSGISDHRLLFNVGTWPAPHLLSIRRSFPHALINISPKSDGDLSAADLAQLQVAARLVGGPVMFPIRHDLMTPGVAHALRPHGRIAIWNTPGITNPADDEADGLRAMGVDGMIDLREPSGLREHATAGAIGVAATILGWDAVERALEALGVFNA